jgi:hypothetical protein
MVSGPICCCQPGSPTLAEWCHALCGTEAVPTRLAGGFMRMCDKCRDGLRVIHRQIWQECPIRRELGLLGVVVALLLGCRPSAFISTVSPRLCGLVFDKAVRLAGFDSKPRPETHPAFHSPLVVVVDFAHGVSAACGVPGRQ